MIPRGYPFPIALRTWIDPTRILFAAPTAAPFTPADLPNPRGTQFPIELRTWLDPLKLTLAPLAARPFTQGDFPNPRGPIGAIDLRSWIANTRLCLVAQGAVPISNAPAPNPGAPLYPIALRTWADPLKQQLLGQTPINNPPAPNPGGAPFPTALRTWTDPLKQQLLGAAGQPAANLEFPNPRGPLRANELLTWLDRTQLALITPPPVFTVGPWDTSDPLFYRHWEKIRDRERVRHGVTALQRDALEEEIEELGDIEAERLIKIGKPPSRALVEALADVRTLPELKALEPLNPAYVAALVAEFHRLVALERQREAELAADEDEIETLLMMVLA